MATKYSYKIVKGVIVKTPIQSTQSVQNPATFYGRERRFSEGRTHQLSNSPSPPSSSSSSSSSSPLLPSVINPSPPTQIRQPIVEEVDISSTITGPPLNPYEDFYLESSKNVDVAAVILFPMNTDPAFSFSSDDFQKRMYYMAMEMNIYGKRVLNLEHAIACISEILMTQRIVHLEIGGHGDGFSIRLPEQVITVGDETTHLEILFSMLVPNSTILLVTCRGGEQIIEYLARIGLGHRFIGVKCDLGPHINLKVESARPLEVKYTTNSGQDVTVVRQYY
jgi:hypothetical protein